MSSFAGLKRLPELRIVRTVDAIAVELTGAHVGQIAVPDVIGALTHADLERLDGVRFAMKQTEVDAGRILGKDREVDTLAVPGCSERIGLAGPDAHLAFSR